MIELVRIIEDQTKLYSYNVTKDEKLAIQLESLFERSKPTNLYASWHPLIATPFRYPPPLNNARFRPPFGKNIFYGSSAEETSLYEHAYHFMKERIHLKISPSTGARTIFVVAANELNATKIIHENNFTAIMDKNDYSTSHQFIINHPKTTYIIYPSCRDPQQRDNAAILDINLLEKNPKWESSIKYFYDNSKKIIRWIDYQLAISWNQVV